MLSFFADLQDPRVERTRLHSLPDIIGLTICAVLSGCDDWESIEVYGENKQDWLKQFLELKNGIPSHDTINRLFASLDTKLLHDCFLEWVKSIAQVTNGRIVSIDGKRLCNSGTKGKKGFIHLVNAWCSTNNMVIGQQKTDEKSNEITAIPALLELLILEGAIVTIDAMGCQTAIAEKIISHQANYVLSVKENQKHLLDDIQETFTYCKQVEFSATTEKIHGRIEKRTCRVVTNLDWISKPEKWPSLSTLICIESERTDLKSLQHHVEKRYYISSLVSTSKHFAQIVRTHWSVENKLHWCLDVVFKEDLSTKQAGNAAENFGVISKIALNIIRTAQTKKKMSLKNKRMLCLMDNDFLAETLFNKN